MTTPYNKSDVIGFLKGDSSNGRVQIMNNSSITIDVKDSSNNSSRYGTMKARKYRHASKKSNGNIINNYYIFDGEIDKYDTEDVVVLPEYLKGKFPSDFVIDRVAETSTDLGCSIYTLYDML